MTESARPVASQPLAALPAYPPRDAKRADTRPQRSAALAARDLGVRSTVFPVYRRGGGPVRGKYRGQMARHVRPRPDGRRLRRVYGQQWQAESAFRRHKRRLGSALRARAWDNQVSEILLRVVVHNPMLLAAR